MLKSPLEDKPEAEIRQIRLKALAAKPNTKDYLLGVIAEQELLVRHFHNPSTEVTFEKFHVLTMPF